MHELPYFSLSERANSLQGVLAIGIWGQRYCFSIDDNFFFFANCPLLNIVLVHGARRTNSRIAGRPLHVAVFIMIASARHPRRYRHSDSVSLRVATGIFAAFGSVTQYLFWLLFIARVVSPASDGEPSWPQ